MSPWEPGPPEPLYGPEDWVMCPGGDCAWKLTCWRFTARDKNPTRPVYARPPYTRVNGELWCDRYLEKWGGPWLLPPW